jgi:hypothetical protein
MPWNLSVGKSAGAVVILLAVMAPLFITSFHAGEDRQAMAVHEPKSDTPTPIPPIDAGVPAVIETATFALG